MEHNLSAEKILSTSHGRRTVDVLNEHLGMDHPYDMTAIADFEREIPKTLGHQAVTVPGAVELLRSLPESSWAIVTSGSRGLAGGWLNCFGMKEPDVFVTSESVISGKPDPSGYRLAANALYCNITQQHQHVLQSSTQHSNSSSTTSSSASSLSSSCSTSSSSTSSFAFSSSSTTITSSTSPPFTSIVFEDAPAGIKAGKASGALAVIGLATTYDPETVKRAGADYVVHDMRSITLADYDQETGVLKIIIKNPIYTPHDVLS